MAINSPSDLFLHELSGVLDAEKKATAWRDEIAGQLRDGDVRQIVRVERQEGEQRIKNLEECFQALNTTPRDVPCATIDGARTELQQVLGQQPAPEALELYAVGSMLKMSHFGVGAYQGLVDRALAMGQTRCAQILRGNLVLKEESAGRLDRIGHEMNQRVMATA